MSPRAVGPGEADAVVVWSMVVLTRVDEYVVCVIVLGTVLNWVLLIVARRRRVAKIRSKIVKIVRRTNFALVEIVCKRGVTLRMTHQ